MSLIEELCFLVLMCALFQFAQAADFPPTLTPSFCPSSSPTYFPTSSFVPTTPSAEPSSTPTSLPSTCPSSNPTSVPTSSSPTSRPSANPSASPSGYPSGEPTTPSSFPSTVPTTQPSTTPSGEPSVNPSSHPSSLPSSTPSSEPSNPSSQPTGEPTVTPSGVPSAQPTSTPTSLPSSVPSGSPTSPSGQPTGQPSMEPTVQPTSGPTSPSGQPTNAPSSQPSGQPTSEPTSPTSNPTDQPVIPLSEFATTLYGDLLDEDSVIRYGLYTTSAVWGAITLFQMFAKGHRKDLGLLKMIVIYFIWFSLDIFVLVSRFDWLLNEGLKYSPFILENDDLVYIHDENYLQATPGALDKVGCDFNFEGSTPAPADTCSYWFLRLSAEMMTQGWIKFSMGLGIIISIVLRGFAFGLKINFEFKLKETVDDDSAERTLVESLMLGIAGDFVLMFVEFLLHFQQFMTLLPIETVLPNQYCLDVQVPVLVQTAICNFKLAGAAIPMGLPFFVGGALLCVFCMLLLASLVEHGCEAACNQCGLICDSNSVPDCLVRTIYAYMVNVIFLGILGGAIFGVVVCAVLSAFGLTIIIFWLFGGFIVGFWYSFGGLSFGFLMSQNYLITTALSSATYVLFILENLWWARKKWGLQATVHQECDVCGWFRLRLDQVRQWRQPQQQQQQPDAIPQNEDVEDGHQELAVIPTPAAGNNLGNGEYARVTLDDSVVQASVDQAFFEGNGFISAEKLRDLNAKMADKLSDDEVTQLIIGADVDGDGNISYDMFVQAMKSKIVRAHPPVAHL